MKYLCLVLAIASCTTSTPSTPDASVGGDYVKLIREGGFPCIVIVNDGQDNPPECYETSGAAIERLQQLGLL